MTNEKVRYLLAHLNLYLKYLFSQFRDSDFFFKFNVENINQASLSLTAVIIILEFMLPSGNVAIKFRDFSPSVEGTAERVAPVDEPTARVLHSSCGLFPKRRLSISCEITL